MGIESYTMDYENLVTANRMYARRYKTRFIAME